MLLFSALLFAAVFAKNWDHCNKFESPGEELRRCRQDVIDSQVSGHIGLRRRLSNDFKPTVHWDRLQNDDEEPPKEAETAKHYAKHAVDSRRNRWLAKLRDGVESKTGIEWCEKLEALLEEHGAKHDPCPGEKFKDKYVEMEVNFRSLYALLQLENSDLLAELEFVDVNQLANHPHPRLHDKKQVDPTLEDIKDVEPRDWKVLYKLDIPAMGVDIDTFADIKYNVDNRKAIEKMDLAKKGYRVGYHLQLDDNYIWTSFDGTDVPLEHLGVPTDWVFQEDRHNLFVHSNVNGVKEVKGEGHTASIEFFPNCYTHGDDQKFDIKDVLQDNDCYGSMQVFSKETQQTLWAWNGWSSSKHGSIGIGKSVIEVNGKVNEKLMDWTFARNIDDFKVKKLSIYVTFKDSKNNTPTPQPSKKNVVNEEKKAKFERLLKKLADKLSDGKKNNVSARKMAKYQRKIEKFEAELKKMTQTRRRLGSVSPSQCTTKRNTNMGTNKNYWNLDHIDARKNIQNIDDPNWTNEIHLEDFEQGEGIEVWVIDGHIDEGHPGFGGRAEVVGMADPSTFLDVNGHAGYHGTFVAGNAAGNDAGVASKALIKNYAVCIGATNSCPWVGSGLRKVVDYKKKNPEKKIVINLSIGASTTCTANPGPVDPVTNPRKICASLPLPYHNFKPGNGPGMWFSSVIDEIIDLDMVFVQAAGNDNFDAASQIYTTNKDAIIVGATGSNDQKAGFSNYGPAVDIWAPGAGVHSYCPRNSPLFTEYCSSSGTSFAAPLVAGVAASIWGTDLSLTAKKVNWLLLASASQLTTIDPTPTNNSPKHFLFKPASPQCGALQSNAHKNDGCGDMVKGYACVGGFTGATTTHMVTLFGGAAVTPAECASKCADQRKDGCCHLGTANNCIFFPDTPSDVFTPWNRENHIMPFLHWNPSGKPRVHASRCDAKTDNRGKQWLGSCPGGHYVDAVCDCNGQLNSAKCGANYCCVKCSTALPTNAVWDPIHVSQYPNLPVGSSIPNWKKGQMCKWKLNCEPTPGGSPGQVSCKKLM